MLKFALLFTLVAVGVYAEFVHVDVTSDDVRAAANHAAKEISKEFSSETHHRLVKISEAQKSNINFLSNDTVYKLKIVLGWTTCKKDEVAFEELGECQLRSGISAYKKCEAVVEKDAKGKLKLGTHGCVLGGLISI